MPAQDDSVLPVVRVGEIARADSAPPWLVEGLWGASSVGVIGGMVRHRGLDLAAVEVHAITAPVLRLDREPDRARLRATTKRLRPGRLLLDPLVRLHGIDENHAGEVAELLAYFRSLQRQLDLAVILVHHTRKNAAGGTAAGLGLRGSSDIHAFGDSNLDLRRSRDQLVLTSEHRAAPAWPPVSLELVTTDAATTHLEVVGAPGASSTLVSNDGTRRSLEQWVLELLSPGAPRTRAQMRESLGVNNQRLGAALESLARAGRLCRTSAGWQRREGSIGRAVPVPPPEMRGNGTVEPGSPESEDESCPG